MAKRLGMIGLVLAMTSGIALAEEDQERGWLGIHLAATSKALQNQLNLEEHSGIVVIKVLEDTPAATAGLQKNDILLAINDQLIDGVEDAVELISSKKPGEEITLTFLRGGNEQSTRVVLGTRPASKDRHHFDSDFDWGQGPMVFKWRGIEHGCDLSEILEKANIDIGTGNVKVEVHCEEGQGTITIDRNGEIETHEFDCEDAGKKQMMILKKVLGDEGEDEDEITIISPGCKLRIPKIKDLDFDFDFDFDNLPGLLKKHKILRWGTEPSTQFKVNPDGQITVTTRKGDDELILTFEDEEDLSARRPELMEKYQHLMEELKED